MKMNKKESNSYRQRESPSHSNSPDLKSIPTAPKSSSSIKPKSNHSFPHKLTLSIENIVATIDLHTELDLQLITQTFKDIEAKQNFPGLVTKFTKPKATLLIFSSGKIVVTGVQLESHLPIILEKTLRKLRKMGLEFKQEPEIHIENMVGRADFKTKINLDMSSITLESAIYEPEIFPGLIYKISDPIKICFLIFGSGKVICTGAKNLGIIQKSLKILARNLKKHNLLGENSKNKESHSALNDDMLEL